MKKLKIETNRIYHGDNMFYMPDMPSESIDLIYIDPPFGTQSLWQSKAFKEKVQEFQFYDVWGKGVNGYINFMVERLRHMHRLLKPTGSLFVHLDWRMSHYIKIELDKIFGVKNPCSNNNNFKNEIIWNYHGNASLTKKNLNKRYDSILWYSKDYKQNKFFKQFLPYRDDQIQRYKLKDKEGKRYYINRNRTNPQGYKIYMKEGVAISNVWSDIQNLTSIQERTGWPTQKPLKLLNRIIKMASKPGDLVADFFCGCGTAIVAAQRLNRKWLGMDASKTACEVMLKRIKEDQPLFSHGIVSKPMTASEFKELSPLDFEKQAVRAIGGVTNHAQIGDGGIDGRLAFDGTPIQVKKFNKPIGDDDKFRGFYEPMKQHGRGIYITLNGYTPKAKERAEAWKREGLDIQLLTIKHILKGKFREQPLLKTQKTKVA